MQKIKQAVHASLTGSLLWLSLSPLPGYTNSSSNNPILLLPYAPNTSVSAPDPRANIPYIGYAPDGAITPSCTNSSFPENYNFFNLPPATASNPGTTCGTGQGFSVTGDLYIFDPTYFSMNGASSTPFYYPVFTASAASPSLLTLTNNPNSGPSQSCTIAIDGNTGMPDATSSQTTCLFYTVNHLNSSSSSNDDSIFYATDLFSVMGIQAQWQNYTQGVFLSLFPSIGVNPNVKQWLLYDQSQRSTVTTLSQGIQCLGLPTPAPWSMLNVGMNADNNLTNPSSVGQNIPNGYNYSPPLLVGSHNNNLYPYPSSSSATSFDKGKVTYLSITPGTETWIEGISYVSQNIAMACNVPNNMSSSITLSRGPDNASCQLFFDATGTFTGTSCLGGYTLLPPSGASTAGCGAQTSGALLNGCQASSRAALDVSLTPVSQGSIVLSNPFSQGSHLSVLGIPADSTLGFYAVFGQPTTPGIPQPSIPVSALSISQNLIPNIPSQTQYPLNANQKNFSGFTQAILYFYAGGQTFSESLSPSCQMVFYNGQLSDRESTCLASYDPQKYTITFLASEYPNLLPNNLPIYSPVYKPYAPTYNGNIVPPSSPPAPQTTRNLTFVNQCPFDVWFGISPEVIPAVSCTNAAGTTIGQGAGVQSFSNTDYSSSNYTCVSTSLNNPTQGSNTQSGVTAYNMPTVLNAQNTTYAAGDVNAYYLKKKKAGKNAAQKVVQIGVPFSGSLSARTGCVDLNCQKNLCGSLSAEQCRQACLKPCSSGNCNPGHSVLGCVANDDWIGLSPTNSIFQPGTTIGTLNIQNSYDQYGIHFHHGVNVPMSIQPSAKSNPLAFGTAETAFSLSPLSGPFWCQQAGQTILSSSPSQGPALCSWNFTPPYSTGAFDPNGGSWGVIGSDGMSPVSAFLALDPSSTNNTLGCQSTDNSPCGVVLPWAAEGLPQSIADFSQNGRFIGFHSPMDICAQLSSTGFPTLNSPFGCHEKVGSAAQSMATLYSCTGLPNCQATNADSSCCGTTLWSTPETISLQYGNLLFPIGAAAAQNGTSGTGGGGGFPSNPNWGTYIKPSLAFLKEGCPQASVYPGDGNTSTFACSNNNGNNSQNYTVTFCPDGLTLQVPQNETLSPPSNVSASFSSDGKTLQIQWTGASNGQIEPDYYTLSIMPLNAQRGVPPIMLPTVPATQNSLSISSTLYNLSPNQSYTLNITATAPGYVPANTAYAVAACSLSTPSIVANQTSVTGQTSAQLLWTASESSGSCPAGNIQYTVSALAANNPTPLYTKTFDTVPNTPVTIPGLLSGSSNTLQVQASLGSFVSEPASTTVLTDTCTNISSEIFTAESTSTQNGGVIFSFSSDVVVPASCYAGNNLPSVSLSNYEIKIAPCPPSDYTGCTCAANQCTYTVSNPQAGSQANSLVFTPSPALPASSVGGSYTAALWATVSGLGGFSQSPVQLNSTNSFTPGQCGLPTPTSLNCSATTQTGGLSIVNCTALPGTFNTSSGCQNPSSILYSFNFNPEPPNGAPSSSATPALSDFTVNTATPYNISLTASAPGLASATTPVFKLPGEPCLLSSVSGPITVSPSPSNPLPSPTTTLSWSPITLPSACYSGIAPSVEYSLQLSYNQPSPQLPTPPSTQTTQSSWTIQHLLPNTTYNAQLTASAQGANSGAPLVSTALFTTPACVLNAPSWTASVYDQRNNSALFAWNAPTTQSSCALQPSDLSLTVISALSPSSPASQILSTNCTNDAMISTRCCPSGSSGCARMKKGSLSLASAASLNVGLTNNAPPYTSASTASGIGLLTVTSGSLGVGHFNQMEIALNPFPANLSAADCSLTGYAPGTNQVIGTWTVTEVISPSLYISPTPSGLSTTDYAILTCNVPLGSTQDTIEQSIIFSLSNF